MASTSTRRDFRGDGTEYIELLLGQRTLAHRPRACGDGARSVGMCANDAQRSRQSRISRYKRRQGEFAVHVGNGF